MVVVTAPAPIVRGRGRSGRAMSQGGPRTQSLDMFGFHVIHKKLQIKLDT